MATMKTRGKIDLALKQWSRYKDALDRGHIAYQKQAKLNENFYLGGGRQWEDDVKKALELAQKPWLEENIIFSTINTVLGYQTQSRMDMVYKPRDNTDQPIADLLTKIGMYIIDQNKFPWLESQVFADGIIQQRGYFDIRMDFDSNQNGDISIDVLDPLNVIPDPDAKTYDPSGWSDVMIEKWMTLDEIKITYGSSKYRQVLKTMPNEADFGANGQGEERNKFATVGTYNAYYRDRAGEEHVKVIERQWYKLINREFWYDLSTGELLPIPDEMTLREKKKVAKENEYEIIKRLTKRIRWSVTTEQVILHDTWSPYDDFTIVPFFPYFRRGVTVGMVDNLIKTQEMLNKTFSQILHVINTTANSGWIIAENSLTNMDIEDLEDVGSQSGLVLEYKSGREPPEKIEPNQVPTGLKDMVTTGVDLIRLISGVSETFQGGKGPEVSGTAIQSRVHQSAIQLATPIDNLFRSRNMIAERVLKLIQQFYTEERAFLISSEEKKDGPQETATINQETEEGAILNDVTVGKYDVVIADVPTQITFQNAQFQQAIEMRKFGVQIPDDEMVKMSTLSRKNEISKKISGETSDEAKKLEQEQTTKQLETMQAQINKLGADREKSESAALKQAAEVAQMLSDNPNLAPILDALLQKNLSEQESDQEDQMEGQEEGYGQESSQESLQGAQGPIGLGNLS